MAPQPTDKVAICMHTPIDETDYITAKNLADLHL